MMVTLGLVAVIVLGVVGSLHLRRLDQQPSPMQARARRDADGGYVGSNTARLIAAQRKRQRRRVRNLQIAGRGGIHRPDTQVSTSWRRTARRH